jgi:omega-amidase
MTIFWPSLVGKPPSDAPGPDEVNYLPLVQRLAKHSAAYVVQCNWPNSLNSPSATHLGESAVVSELGEVLFSLPRDQPGVATFVLGEKEYEWIPVAV